MILVFDKELAEIGALLHIPLSDKEAMGVAMILAGVLDRGMGMAQDRCISIVQRNRNVINPAQVVAEIRKPIR